MFIGKLLEQIYVNPEQMISSKTYKRILNRLTGCGNDRAQDKTCINFLKKAQEELNTSFLLNQNIKHSNENNYIANLVFQLIEMIVSTDFFNYIQNTKSVKYICYVNQLKMIESNIENIYDEQDNEYDIWKQILVPLKNMIILCEFPGMEEGIWLETNNNLKFYDCTFNITDKYNKYIKCILPNKEKFKFNLGENREQFNEIIKKKNEYFKYKGIKNYDDWDETVKVFQQDVIETFKIIVKNKFNIFI